MYIILCGVIFPVFLIMFLIVMGTMIFDDTGPDPYSLESYLKAQTELRRRWQERYRIRVLKEEQEAKIEKQKEEETHKREEK